MMHSYSIFCGLDKNLPWSMYAEKNLRLTGAKRSTSSTMFPSSVEQLTVING